MSPKRSTAAKRSRTKAAKEQDAAPPGPTRQLILRVPDELHAGLRHLSIDRRESINKMLLKVIDDWYTKQQNG